ncbi:MAG TPA: hypothetical protein PKD86_13425 [Gemmatales bacterium]|nr:hypothetical protein [Gemmatales bacterium]
MMLGCLGCQTIEGYPVRWPWKKPSMLVEKYNVPPMADARYTDPQTYPKSTITPVLKREDPEEQRRNAARRGMPGGGAAAGMP